jgi:tetraacyldisaccharide 4'-kinase
MKIFKPNFWDSKNNIISFFLLPISILLQIFLVLKTKVISKKKVSIPVICVGNIYLGGTGKTPLSLEIINILRKFNKKAAIIKKHHDKHRDEFRLIESRGVALFKSASRYKAIKEAIKNKFNCVVLDDGFHDSSITKNLNILCFNEKQLVGNGMTLPSGPLRESFSSLKRCQLVVINGDSNLDFEKKIKNISNDIKIYYSKYIPINIEIFKKKNLLAFAGIGNPKNFFDLLEENNLKVIKKVSFPDHHNFTLKELIKLIEISVKNNLKIITTEKDFFRIKHFKLKQIEYLNVRLKILNTNDFEKEIVKCL